jgi:glycosyltransferase involved in cell wall biosynthesis
MSSPTSINFLSRIVNEYKEIMTMQDLRKGQSTQSRKIAVYYPCFLGGGAEAVALWMLEALKDKYDVTLVTCVDLDWQRLNTLYGTSLHSESVKVSALLPNLLYGSTNALASNNKNFRQLAIHLTLRHLKQHHQDHDLVISAYNAADLGKKGLQYIHWIKVLEGGKLARKYYNRISHFSEENLKKNVSLANSQVVAKAVKEHYGLEAIVVYPPVVIKAGNVPWEEKEDAFICSGRLVEAKQPHRVIQCLQKVRQQGFKIKLYITGGGGGSAEAKYKRYLDRLVEENADWVEIYENLSYEDYSQLLYRCKYGIHFKPEPFGISVAEMVKAGIIPFVRNEWGPLEIIGQENQALFFSDFEDSIEKITDILANHDKQNTIIASLEKRKLLFSPERFMAEINHVVMRYFKGDL